MRHKTRHGCVPMRLVGQHLCWVQEGHEGSFSRLGRCGGSSASESGRSRGWRWCLGHSRLEAPVLVSLAGEQLPVPACSTLNRGDGGVR